MSKAPCVYILSSHYKGTLYIGVTSDLVKRIWEHRNNLAKGFTQKYVIHRLVYYEMHEDMVEAITREKNLWCVFAPHCAGVGEELVGRWPSQIFQMFGQAKLFAPPQGAGTREGWPQGFVLGYSG